jgi:hypothetical protein
MTAFAPVVLAWAKDVDGEQTGIFERTNVTAGPSPLVTLSVPAVPES